MQYIAPRYFILQYLVEHSDMFRYLMGSPSGNHIKVTLHKIEIAIHVPYITKLCKTSTSKNVGICCTIDPGILCFGECLHT
jgi:hypothetical protein